MQTQKQTKWQKMVARVDAKKAAAEKRAEQWRAWEAARRNAPVVIIPAPAPETKIVDCAHGKHDYKTVATGRCYVKAICQSCGDVNEVDSSD